MLWGAGMTWFNKTLWNAPGALEGITYNDFDDLHDGKELCVTGYSNTAVMLYETETGWYNEIIYHDPDPLQTELNGASATDFYEPNSGHELLLIGFTGPVWMLTFRPPDFKLNTTLSSKSVVAGEFATYSINLEIISSYNSSIELILENLPFGCTFNFSKSMSKFFRILTAIPSPSFKIPNSKCSVPM